MRLSDRMPSLYVPSSKADLWGVEKLKNKLSTRGVACVSGAPGTGKSELLKLALEGKRVFLWDQRQEFLKEACPDLTPEEKKDQYKTAAAKLREAGFLSPERLTALREEIAGESYDAVMLDEFDLGLENQLNLHEEETALKLLNFAESLKRDGYQVVIVLHDEGIDSPAITAKLRKMGIGRADIVFTEFFSNSDQDKILDEFGEDLSSETREGYKTQTDGLPGAFVPLLKSSPGKPLTRAQLYDGANKVLTSALKVFLGKASEPVKGIFSRLAEEGKISRKEIPIEVVPILERSGMVKTDGHKVWMPTLARTAWRSLRQPSVDSQAGGS